MKFLSLLILAVFVLTACSAAPVIDPLPPQSPDDGMTESPVMEPVKTESPLEIPLETPDPIGGEDPLPENGDDMDNTYSPRPGDDQLGRGNIYLNSVELLILESFPVQINLQLTGGLPTPCHQLRVAVDPPDKENRIYIDVYSVVDADKICVQVIEPFATTVSLGTFPAGQYSVYVNNELIGEFDS